MDFNHPPEDPLAAFTEWFADAQSTNLPNPNAMSVATIDPDGRPSSRIMLLKSIDARGPVFYTNLEGRKGRALAANPCVALLFHWDVLDRQVRIEGSVTRVSDEEADAYFATRPRGAQLGAWASRQSEPVRNRAELDRAVAEVDKQFEGKSVPRPPHWSGFRVSPQRWEFWQGQPARLHDRIEYVADGEGGWVKRRLFP